MDHPELDAIARFLNAGSMNYSVFLRAYVVESGQADSAATLVRRAVGDAAVIEMGGAVSVHDVLADMTSSLAYAGGEGSGPDGSRLYSDQFRELLSGVISMTCKLADRSTRIERFKFKNGHPAYPVFWNFAFLLTGSGESVVFVGAGSD
jgi:hypothetical protein